METYASALKYEYRANEQFEHLNIALQQLPNLVLATHTEHTVFACDAFKDVAANGEYWYIGYSEHVMVIDMLIEHDQCEDAAAAFTSVNELIDNNDRTIISLFKIIQNHLE
eukprot:CAMPEP_0202695982 /NCGR_PEP_ID=MMETSP1385-20130828/9390_1 /ASSEMBLY_ACC=CAM_ASM_000861 /TAXON_ID=933848 /ORGANISM="Elphidium margaritaceum" /LENGTH=110 /DNA_ID=CAMNT_0049352073 /DNA_START=765 /DNA_END=1094 /DNA_ORIENTATION=-